MDSLNKLHPKLASAICSIKQKIIEGWSIAIGLSGKDSFVTVHCAIEALKQVADDGHPVAPMSIYTIDTSIDNFEILDFMLDVHQAINEYASNHHLPIQTEVLKPHLMTRPMVQYLGRGLLLRTAQNQHKGRQCTSVWKIKVLEDHLRALEKKLGTSRVLSISGVRDAESSIRALNIKKRGESIDVVTKTDIGYKLAPIKDWSLSDVWSLISLIENDEIESFGEDVVTDLRKHYAAGNSGVCDLLAGSSAGQSKPCSARFGCTLCAIVPKDNSLINQIETNEAKYGYMRGIAELRNYMLHSLNDFNLSRNSIGKQIDKNGNVKLKYNDYSIEFRQSLLRMVLTLDAIEQERTDNPKFQLVDYSTLIAIQWNWAIEGGEGSFGTAIKIWHDVHTNGERYPIPSIEMTPRKNNLKARYVSISKLLESEKPKGLEMTSEEKEKYQAHAIYSDNGVIHTMPYFTSDKTEVVSGMGWEYIECIYPHYQDEGLTNDESVCPTAIIKDLMQRGVVTVQNSSLNRLNERVKRAQAINAIKARGGDIESYLLLNSTDTPIELTKIEPSQTELF